MKDYLLLLKDTPLPAILVIGGIIFLLLSVLQKAGTSIETKPGKEKSATVIGVLLLFAGIGLFLVPGANLSTSPTQTPTSVASTIPPVQNPPTSSTQSPSILSPAVETKMIGISMPTKIATRWITDGESMVKSFNNLGYRTDLQYADDDTSIQLSQIENMITEGVNVLVIASVDGYSLSNVVQKAHAKGILVVAYDRLISKTPNVDYYATFDNFGVGVIQGSQIETSLGLKDGKGPFSIELFGGSPDDTNAIYFYNGAMSILQPYINSGKLVVQSGEIGIDKVGTLNWLSSNAQARMDKLLSLSYASKRVDAILSPYDGLSRGIIFSLRDGGYGTVSQPWPVITGQDCEIDSIKAMIAGEQMFSVFKDTRELAKQVSVMVDNALKGKPVQINDSRTYNNGVKVVPSYLLTPVSIDITNYQSMLIDSGYINAADLK